MGPQRLAKLESVTIDMIAAYSKAVTEVALGATTFDRFHIHSDGILEYVRDRLTNGRVERLSDKTRTITRRSYDFHAAPSLIAMIFLCCGGIYAQPAHVGPFRTH